MRLPISALLVVCVLGTGMVQAYAFTAVEKFDTLEGGVYTLGIEYRSTGDSGRMNVFWNGDSIATNVQSSPELGLFSMEVTADNKESDLKVHLYNTAIESISLEYQGQVTESQIKERHPDGSTSKAMAGPETAADPRDAKIADLEQKVTELEREVTGLKKINSSLDSANKELTKINDALQNQVDLLQSQISDMTEQFMVSVSQLNSWFQEQTRD